ncbi:MAG: hypothetical protein ACOC93_01920 [Planctomycetota bacterium]
MIIEKTARQTLTAVEMDRGDELHFTLADGTVRRITVQRTWATLHETNLEDLGQPQPRGHSVVRMHCELHIDGTSVSFVRWVGSQESFYQPYELFGLRIWFDAVSDLFDILSETHGPCKPRKHIRLAIQDASLRTCPELLHPWCPLPEGGLRIEDCYEACDCWMGPYFGAEAHGGLDINHPAGTPIWTPLALDEQGLFNRVDAGDNNNRWRGIRRWPDGSTWILQVHHLIRLRVAEDSALPAGVHLADGAGVRNGSREHSHFVFKVLEPGAAEGEERLLDPWILFWQMYQDRQATTAR